MVGDCGGLLEMVFVLDSLALRNRRDLKLLSSSLLCSLRLYDASRQVGESPCGSFFFFFHLNSLNGYYA